MISQCTILSFYKTITWPKAFSSHAVLKKDIQDKVQQKQKAEVIVWTGVAKIPALRNQNKMKIFSDMWGDETTCQDLS